MEKFTTIVLPTGPVTPDTAIETNQLALIFREELRLSGLTEEEFDKRVEDYITSTRPGSVGIAREKAISIYARHLHADDLDWMNFQVAMLILGKKSVGIAVHDHDVLRPAVVPALTRGCSVEDASEVLISMFESLPVGQSHITRPLNVQVTGLTHTGKTLVVSIIEHALIEAGFTNVKLNNPEEHTHVRQEQLQQFLTSVVGADEFLGKEITITEVDAPRPLGKAMQMKEEEEAKASQPKAKKRTSADDYMMRDLPSAFVE